jgi:hypothetical protein
VGAAALLQAPSAQAYGNGPWCAIYSVGNGSSVENCQFYNFEACRQEITGGNRGFCRPSSYWPGGAGPYAPYASGRRPLRPGFGY